MLGTFLLKPFQPEIPITGQQGWQVEGEEETSYQRMEQPQLSLSKEPTIPLVAPIPGQCSLIGRAEYMMIQVLTAFYKQLGYPGTTGY